jgi:hypothetical protein
MKEKRIWIFGSAAAAATALVIVLLSTQVLAGPTPSVRRDTLAPPVPGQFTYQGLLTDQNGNPVADGDYDMVFTIYDHETTGNALWSQTFSSVNAVQVAGGQFTVYLGGTGNQIRPDAFTGAPRWLGVKVGTDPEMTPRTPLTSVPYALRAETLRVGGVISDTVASPLYTFNNPHPAGLALLAQGNVHVAGDLTWSARTGRIAVPAAAFEPGTDTFTYHNNGSNLYSTFGANYFAPVQLPDGATVTKMTFHYYDDAAAGDVTMKLNRYDLAAHLVYVVAEATSTDGGYGDDYDDTISYAQVDNAANSYYLYATFGATGIDLKVHAVVIEYEFEEPY